MRQASGALALAALALLAGAGMAQRTQRNGREVLHAIELVGKKASDLDARLGKPRSVGQKDRFREYAIPNAGVFVGFRNAVSDEVVVTFRIPFNSPAEAVAALGVVTTGRRPSYSGVVEKAWRNIGGFKWVSVRSTDGRLWETVSLSNVPHE